MPEVFAEDQLTEMLHVLLPTAIVQFGALMLAVAAGGLLTVKLRQPDQFAHGPSVPDSATSLLLSAKYPTRQVPGVAPPGITQLVGSVRKLPDGTEEFSRSVKLYS